MKTKIFIIVIILGYGSLVAQKGSLQEVLSEIEKNNTTLKALREDGKAQKLSNKSGIYLTGPEAEIAYLWGNPSAIGSRTDISIKQSFDIPTITGIKSKLAKDQNNLVDIQLEADRAAILLEAKQLYIKLIYYNALQLQTKTRLQHAETIAQSTKMRLDKGDASILEYNKSQLYQSSVQAEAERVEIERNEIIAELKRLNGGTEIVTGMTQYDRAALPPDFKNWFNEVAIKNPALLYANKAVDVNKKQLTLHKTANLPSLSAGYMSEKVVGQQYRGFTVGVSVPLWEHKNRVKQAQAALLASETHRDDNKLQVYNQYQLLYNKAVGLLARVERVRKSVSVLNNTELLKKALDKGEISLVEYVLEMGLYYEYVNNMLEAERDYELTVAELRAAEL